MLSSRYFRHFVGVREVMANLCLTETVGEKLYQPPGIYNTFAHTHIQAK